MLTSRVVPTGLSPVVNGSVFLPPNSVASPQLLAPESAGMNKTPPLFGQRSAIADQIASGLWRQFEWIKSKLTGQQLGPSPELAKDFPPTRRENITEDHFGVPVNDPYRWLEDENSPEVQSWMGAQDGYARQYVEQIPVREKLKKRFTELFARTQTWPATEIGGYSFYIRQYADKDHKVVFVKKGESDAERVLLDPNNMSPDGKTALTYWRVSDDGKKVVYKLNPNNADHATLYVRDVKTGVDSAIDVINGARYASPIWDAEGKGFYYTKIPMDPTIPEKDLPGHAHVRYHRLGTDPKSDKLIYPATWDPTKFVTPSLSRDKRFLFITIQHGWGKTNVLYKDLLNDGPQTAFRFLFSGEGEAVVDDYAGQFYITTNDGSPRGRVYRVPVNQAHDRSAWVQVVPEHSNAVLQEMKILGGRLLLHYTENVSSRLEIRDLNGVFLHSVDIPKFGVVSSMSGKHDQDEVSVGFNSLVVPPQSFKLSMQTGKLALKGQSDLPVDPSNFEMKQEWFTSKDGTRVPMFIVRKKDAPRDGKMPFLIYGYGGFNVNQDPAFRTSIYPWLEAGGGFALANIRGGAEFGEQWHQDGMRDKKQNVFDDFMAGARFLVDQGYTSPDRLAAEGGSNGGLLMGAMLTQAKDKFRAVICSVPLLDMIRYHLFGSGQTWISEYGNPSQKEDFAFIHRYSPYHHVGPGAYPSTLFMSATHDDRVDPLHARKMAAAVQNANTGSNPVLLRIEPNAGHGGGAKMSATIESYADKYAFLMHELGMTQ